MAPGNLTFGIPDIDLVRSCGGKVNPSHFVGHQLVVLFLPTDPHERAIELEQYQRLAQAFADVDGWLLAVASNPERAGQGVMPIEVDPKGEAWQAFIDVAKPDNFDRLKGAAFLFTRGGAFHRCWSGPGHASEVLEELRTRG